ncbi:unnamed protein product [Closterium sp. NIES-64]|nr:unnamed protein product [Closterium sp. NIES-64]
MAKHAKYIKNLDKKTEGIEYVATEHLRMSGAYWGLTAMDLMGRLKDMHSPAMLPWLLSCQQPNGGFGGSQGHDSHLLYTLSAVQILALLDKLDAVDADRVATYVAGLQQLDGSFIGDEWGEVDTRAPSPASPSSITCTPLTSQKPRFTFPEFLRLTPLLSPPPFPFLPLPHPGFSYRAVRFTVPCFPAFSLFHPHPSPLFSTPPHTHPHPSILPLSRTLVTHLSTPPHTTPYFPPDSPTAPSPASPAWLHAHHRPPCSHPSTPQPLSPHSLLPNTPASPSHSFSYCAISCLSLLDRMHAIDLPAAVQFIASCQNFDGGFGSVPGGESHAGQIFCCVAALAIAGVLSLVDRDLLGWWLCERQVPAGGLNGRPEKLPDVCYSWWVLSSLVLIDRVHWISAEKLQHFILQCQDEERGGISDRPNDMVDVFHTFFGIAGLSLLEYPNLKPVDPAYALPVDVVDRVFRDRELKHLQA